MDNQKILERYKDKRSEIQEYMRMLVDSLEEKYGEISESFIVSLDLLALNLEILLKSTDEMKDKGMTETDKYRGEKKSGAMQAFFNSQNYIHKILGNFGFSPASASKIKDNKIERDTKDYLNDLING